MTYSEYTRLKEDLIVAVGNTNYDILTIKELFNDIINSVRRLEQINSVGQLLKLLELRGFLSEDNVKPLKTIAQKIERNDLLSHINSYEETYVHQEFVSFNSSEKPNYLGSCSNNQNVCCGISMKKKEKIHKAVIEAIGSSWRQLGRNLNIPEYIIDQIDFDSKNLSTKASKLMKKFDERVNPQTWFFVLCDALEKVPRRDIVRSLREIVLL